VNSGDIADSKGLFPSFKSETLAPFLVDQGVKPLTDLAKFAIRRNKVETINDLLAAGADPVIVGRELMSKRLGYPLNDS
jgi:hypothetical protein